MQMSPISDFNITLVDGGLTFSTSDLNYENSLAPTPNYAPLPINNDDELQTINLDIV
jgi:hypothetical protein